MTDRVKAALAWASRWLFDPIIESFESALNGVFAGALAAPAGPRPRVIKRNFGGDPFCTLIEYEGRFYILDEAEQIISEEAAMGRIGVDD